MSAGYVYTLYVSLLIHRVKYIHIGVGFTLLVFELWAAKASKHGTSNSAVSHALFLYILYHFNTKPSAGETSTKNA